MGRAKRSRSASTTPREVPGAKSDARAPDMESTAPCSPAGRSCKQKRDGGALTSASSAAAATSRTPEKQAAPSAKPSRPTVEESAKAHRIIERLKNAGLMKREKANTTAVVACAVALHGKEVFASDRIAMDLFGVCPTTKIRSDWVVGKLEKLLEYNSTQRAAQAAQAAAEAAANRPVPRREAERAARRAAKEAAKGARCEGTTNLNVRCMVYANSGHKEAEPLRKGGRFCTWHDPALRAARVADFAERSRDAVRCAGLLKGTHRPCRLTSAMWHGEAEPLRRGSPFCHHHRVRCEGRVRGGDRCCVTSSSSHAHAAPLRRGAHFCAHHTARVACTLSVGPTVKLTLAVRAR